MLGIFDVTKPLNFNTQKTKIYLLSAIALLFLLQFFYLNFEYPYKAQSYWHIHHDEKLIVPDARCFFLKDIKQINISDYKPSISAAFGVAGPMISTLGFKIFGMNNVGLRFFFLIAAAISTVLGVLLILSFAPGPTGLFFSLAFIFNYNNLLLSRHAILENFLTLFILTILWLYTTRPKLFLNNLPKICFIAGITTFFKQNFIIYVYLLLFLITVIEVKNFKKISKIFFYSVISVILFELIHLIILSKIDTTFYRYKGFLLALATHIGISGNEFSNITLLQHFSPIGSKIFSIFPLTIANWYGFLPLGAVNSLFSRSAVVTVFFLVWIGYLILTVRKNVSNQLLVVIIYATIIILSFFPFFFYVKRAVSFFPIFIIIFAAFFEKLNRKIDLSFRNMPIFVVAIRLSLIILAIGYSVFQLSIFTNMSNIKNKKVESNSISLDIDLPENSSIYTHCYGYRFFWQEKEQRLFSGDDQFLSNFMIFAWAVKDHGKYIMLSSRGGTFAFQADAAFYNWFAKNIIPSLKSFNGFGGNNDKEKIMQNLQQIKRIKGIKTYVTSEVESDVADQYVLAEIVYK